MALINIGGVDMPTPSEFTVGIQDVVKAERNAKATMIMELIGVKQKIEMKWSYLTAAQLSQILTAVKPLFFTVTYPNPETNTIRTATFYKGDRTSPMLWYRAGVAHYKDLKFNLIER
jgi:predicted molibdopterin-dependent oxidoreductase YjgC